MSKKSIQNFPALAIILSIAIAAPLPAREAGWRYYFRKAELQYAGERYAFALENYVKALDRNPKAFEAANRIAAIYLIQNKKRDALDYLARSLSIREGQAEIQNLAGEQNEFFGYYEESFARYLKAVSIDPSFARAHLNLVRYYVKRRDLKKAGEHFAACERAGRAEGERQMELAAAEERRGNEKGALARYHAALEKNPVMIEAHMAIVEIHRRNNRTAEAIERLERIKEIKPDFEKAYVYCAHLYFAQRYSKRRKYILDMAIRNLKSAIDLNPYSHESCYLLAEIYRFIGDDLNEKEYYERARELERSAANR